MRNSVKAVVASAMVVGMTASAAAQSYKPPIFGVTPPVVVVVTPPTSGSYKPAFTRADAAAQVAAARAQAAAARAAASAARAAARGY